VDEVSVLDPKPRLLLRENFRGTGGIQNVSDEDVETEEADCDEKQK
jgi:hypothetical protein